jgi:hypothetical protein
MLPAATQAEILRLSYAERWSLSKIARHVGVQRASVRKVIRRRSVALTRPPPGRGPPCSPRSPRGSRPCSARIPRARP